MRFWPGIMNHEGIDSDPKKHAPQRCLPELRTSTGLAGDVGFRFRPMSWIVNLPESRFRSYAGDGGGYLRIRALRFPKKKFSSNNFFEPSSSNTQILRLRFSTLRRTLVSKKKYATAIFFVFYEFETRKNRARYPLPSPTTAHQGRVGGGGDLVG